MKSLIRSDAGPEKPAPTGKNSHEIGRFKAAKPAAFLPFAAAFLPKSAGSLPETCRFLAGSSQNVLTVREALEKAVEQGVEFAHSANQHSATSTHDQVEAGDVVEPALQAQSLRGAALTALPRTLRAIVYFAVEGGKAWEPLPARTALETHA